MPSVCFFVLPERYRKFPGAAEKGKYVDNWTILCGFNVDELWITQKYRPEPRKWTKKLDISNFIKYNFLIHYRNVTNNTNKANKM